MIRTKLFSVWAVLSFTLVFASGCDRGERPQMIGKPAPEFTVKDSDRSVALRDLRGKVVVLNFWATWCPPCVEETPSLVAMQAQMKDRVLVFAVSTDQDEAAYHRFIKDHNVNFLTVRDADQKSNALYGTFGYPETYIIDREGILRRKFIGPVDWTKLEIIEYLSKL
jgi:cytochrome c biogenesis protein CcmG/thiol:disulfide interchange protein DsbE